MQMDGWFRGGGGGVGQGGADDSGGRGEGRHGLGVTHTVIRNVVSASRSYGGRGLFFFILRE